MDTSEVHNRSAPWTSGVLVSPPPAGRTGDTEKWGGFTLGGPMPKPLWFAWYPGDYLTDAIVLSMSLAQQGAYIRLLSLAACNDGIPDPPTNLIGQEGIWCEPLVSCWIPHPEKPGFLHNPRLLKELAKADAKREAGSKAVNSRKDRQLQRPYNDRRTTDLLVEKSRVEKRRTNGSIEPLGNLLRSSLGIEGKSDAKN